MKPLIFTIATIIGISALLSTATSSTTADAQLKEADSLMQAHYKIEEAMEFNGHSYSDAIDLGDLEYYYDAFKANPSEENYEKFSIENAKIESYESDMAADFQSVAIS